MPLSPKLKKLLLSLLIPQLAGILGSLFTAPNIAIWYAGLRKPSLLPPNWLFGPVWITLFLLMGVSYYLIWTTATIGSFRRARRIYFTQLILNLSWSGLFFGLHEPPIALLCILFLWLAILINLLRFYHLNRLAGLLLLPYLLWVSFAAYLNLMIVLLNPY